ncbi:MAG: macrolide family glycosyltransferase [Pseudonocardiaceae bacterium]
MLDTGLDVLGIAAKLRPVFHSVAELDKPGGLVRLAEGPITPALVCIPPFVAPSGTHNYARLALNLHKLRDVYSLSHPGFGDHGPLPATLELVIAMHAQAVRQHLGDTPFAMVGYSSGGWFAHAMAAHLETLGIFPTAVVLLDSLAVRDDAWDHIRAPLTTMALNDQAFALMTDDQLTATAAYFRFFENWKPATITAPVLLVRPTECVPEWMGRPISEEYWRASWNFTHEIMEVTGHHYSMMKENAASTALALHRWLGGQERHAPAAHRYRGHIAMFGIPAHGHVNPSLAVMRELADRGYRVTYSITEEFAPQVAATGATPVLYRSTMPSESDPTSAFPKDDLELMSMALEEAMTVLPQLEAAYDTDRPDLVLYDIGGYTAPVLAAKWDIPIIQLSPTHVVWKGYEQDRASVIEAMRIDPAGIAYHAKFITWLQDHGIDQPFAEFMRPQQCIALFPRVLQPHETKVAETYTFVGPCFDDRSHQGSWQAPGDSRPVLLISLGSAYTDQAEFYRECIAAFGDLDWHVVMAIGRYVDPDGLGPIPDNIEVHRWVPQLSVLSQAAAFITHAGMGGTMEGLYYGVPMVAVPQAMDQYVNAERIAELGVGQHLPSEQAGAVALREAVLAVASDPGIAGRLRRIQEEMRRAGGTTAAADLIEQRLMASSPSAGQ